MKLLLVLSAVFAFGASRPSNPAFHEPILKLYSSLGNQGQYSYGYSGSSSSKSESRSSDGLTRGSYSYVDGDGVLQKVSYQADAKNGFRVTATNLPMAPSGGAASSGGNFHALARGSTRYGSTMGLESARGRSGIAGASYGTGAELGTGQVAALEAGLGSGSSSYSFGSGTALGVEHEAGLDIHLGSGGSYSFSAPATPSNSQFAKKNKIGAGAGAGVGAGVSGGIASLYGAPGLGDSSLLSESPLPPRDTPEVLAAKARHFAAFEAAKINAATSIDDSAQHDDGQYKPNPNEDDGSYKDDGNALGSGFKGVEAYDDGQYRPNPYEDDGSYKGENMGLEAGFGAGFGAGAGFRSGTGFGSTVDAGKGAGAGISPGGLPGVTGSGAGIGAGYGAGLGAGAKPGFKGLDAVSTSGAGAGAGYGAGLGAQISQLGAAAGFGPFGASASAGPFGVSFSAGRFGASIGSGPKTPASTQTSNGYDANGYFTDAVSLVDGARARSDAFGGQFKTPASTQSSDGYGAGARGSSSSAFGRYGSNIPGRFYSIPPSFPGFSQYYNQQGLGQYTYGYSADDQSSHQESRSSDGSTQGKYSYIDTNGILQTVKYISDARGGFRVKATNLPIAPAA